MKDPLKIVVLFAATLVVGCSDPEAEANKVFTEASQLVKEAEAVTEPDSFEAYKKRKKAIELIEKIPSKYPTSSLSVEISKGDFKVHGQTVNEIRRDIRPASISIHEAAENGNVEAIKRHIYSLNDVNAKGVDGATPLHYATIKDHSDIVAILITSGAEVNAQMESIPSGVYGLTPFDVAKKLDHKEILDVLQKNGGKSGQLLSICVASFNGNISAIKKHLNDGSDIDVKGQKGFRPLHLAVIRGHKETVKLLINKGAQINERNDDGWTPLHVTTVEGKTEIAELLIQHGAFVNAKGNIEETPYELALHFKNEKIAKLLLGASKIPADRALFFALIGGDLNPDNSIKTIKERLEAGVDLTAKYDHPSFNGGTPLHVAASMDNSKIAEIIIQAGSNLNDLDNDGNTPLNIARNSKYNQAAALLKSVGAKTSAELKASQN